MRRALEQRSLQTPHRTNTTPSPTCHRYRAPAKTIKQLATALLLTLAVPTNAHQGAPITAPILEGIVIDGYFSDWPAQIEEHPSLIQTNAYGPTDLLNADLTTSPDLSPSFKIGYSVEEQLLYLAITVRDDRHILDAPGGFYENKDQVEVYVDGDHSGGIMNRSIFEKSLAQHFQFYGLAGERAVWQGSHPTYDLSGGNIALTQTRMAYDRSGDITTYEWALQVFDRYPDTPAQLLPGKTLGFDTAIIDQDGNGDGVAWVSWTPKGGKNINADLLGDVVLGHSLTAGGKTGILAGTAVNGENQIPAPGIALVAYQDGQATGVSHTGASGYFRFYLPPGDYAIKLQPGQAYEMAATHLSVSIGEETTTDLSLTPIHLPAALAQTAALYAGLNSYRDSMAVEIDQGLETTTAAFAWQKPDHLRSESVDWTTGNLTALYNDSQLHTRYESEFQQYVEQDPLENSDFSLLADPMPGLRLVQQLLLSDDAVALLRRGLDAARSIGRESLDGQTTHVIDLTLLPVAGSIPAAARTFAPVDLRLWLDAETYALRQVTYQVDGRPYTEYYHHIELDPTFATDHFHFKAPASAERAFRMGEGKEKAELIGQPAPGFALADYEGKPIDLADFSGQVVLLDFWGTWCPPCRMAMPGLIDLHATYADQGFNIVAISVPPDDADAVRQYAADNGITFPLPLADKTVRNQYGVKNYPTTLFVDKQGTVRYAHIGYSEGMKASYTNHIKELLAE